MNRLANPYKLDESLPPLIHLQVDVSVADWEKVFLAFPYRGLQDKLLSVLFQAFITEASKHLEPIPNPDNEAKLLQILSNLNFKP